MILRIKGNKSASAIRIKKWSYYKTMINQRKKSHENSSDADEGLRSIT